MSQGYSKARTWELVDPGRPSWMENGVCRGDEDPDAWFRPGTDAADSCLGCPVRVECDRWATENRIEYGVWGGVPEDVRRKRLKLRPQTKPTTCRNGHPLTAENRTGSHSCRLCEYDRQSRRPTLSGRPRAACPVCGRPLMPRLGRMPHHVDPTTREKCLGVSEPAVGVVA